MATTSLAPSSGVKKIQAGALMPADIIVSTTDAASSLVIRSATASSVSHVMLYVGHNMVIEAVGDGVVERLLTKALSDAVLGVAYRYRNLDPTTARNIIAHARKLVGKKYDYAGAAGGGAKTNPALCNSVVSGAFTPGFGMLPGILAGKVLCDAAKKGKWQDQNKYYCSELVLESYEKAGIRLVSGSPGTSVPQQIIEARDRGLLEYVGHLRS